jgi:hypothetical protein
MYVWHISAERENGLPLSLAYTVHVARNRVKDEKQTPAKAFVQDTDRCIACGGRRDSQALLALHC